MQFVAANFLILLAICAVLFGIGIFMYVIGITRMRRAEFMMQQLTYEEIQQQNYREPWE